MGSSADNDDKSAFRQLAACVLRREEWAYGWLDRQQKAFRRFDAGNEILMKEFDTGD
jgi:hypothetical protein